MEPQSTFVRTNGAVELNAVALVDVNIARIVGPRNAEHNGAFWLDNTLQKALALVLWIVFDEWNNRFGDFDYSLHKFRLVWVCSIDLCNESIDLRLILVGHKCLFV